MIKKKNIVLKSVIIIFSLVLSSEVVWSKVNVMGDDHDSEQVSSQIAIKLNNKGHCMDANNSSGSVCRVPQMVDFDNGAYAQSKFNRILTADSSPNGETQ